MSAKKQRTTRKPRSRRVVPWMTAPVDELLETPLRNLHVSIDGTMVGRLLDRLYGELEAREIMHRPHVWVSSEWFSPDGVPGFAVPFYLLHPRLARLERRMMLEVEGGSAREGMKILRHEAGHAICTAYRLHYKRRWREIFGRYSDPYPTYYMPDPTSREFVLHFNAWYAQAHPAEDFAETFAVWLRPRAQWRRQYRGWAALRKLEFVDSLMEGIKRKRPTVRSRVRVEPLRELRITLREHYVGKRRRYAEDWPDFFDRDLRRVFSNDPKHARRETAARFLLRVRPRILGMVAEWTGHHPYNIDQLVKDIIDRCKELKLRLARPKKEAELHIALMLAVQTMNYLHAGRHAFAI